MASRPGGSRSPGGSELDPPLAFSARLGQEDFKKLLLIKKSTCTVPDPTFLLAFSPTEARLQVCVAMEQLPFPCPDTTGPSALRPRQLPGLLLPSPPPGESLRSCLACAVLRHGTERAP